MARKTKARNKIPRMSDKDLRKLRDNLERTAERVREQERQARRFLNDVQHSAEELYRLAKRTKYYIGKHKAMQCPAFAKGDRYYSECKAMDWSRGSWQNLFVRDCANCVLTNKEAVTKATFRGIFGHG